MRRTLSKRGQVTIPKVLRDRFGMRSGTKVEFEVEGGRVIISKVVESGSLASVYGVLNDGRRTNDLIGELRGVAGAEKICCPDQNQG